MTTGPIGDDELDGLFRGLAGNRLALAVSGGADSMALMHLVARWLASAPNSLPPPIALTVDHGLRREAADEAAFVRREAEKLGFVHRTLAWTPPASPVMQAEARAARYRLLARELASEGPSDTPQRILVTAHHADDQAETFLMRLARGSGLDGLSGMQPRKLLRIEDEDGASLELTIVRPLLGVAAERLADTLRAAGRSWCNDPSNDDEKFERVRIRRALDGLAGLGIDARAITRSMGRLDRARAGYLDLVAHGPLRDVDWHGGLLGEVDLQPMTADVRVRVLERLLLAFGGAAKPARLAQIEALAARMTAGSVDETLGGCRVEAAASGRLRVYREIGRTLEHLALVPGQQLAWDGGRFSIGFVGDTARPTVTVSALGGAAWADLKRAVPDLADLKLGGRSLPAAAVASLPAFRSGDGTLLAVPWLDELLIRSGSQAMRRAWRNAVPAPTGAFAARFNGHAASR